MKRFALFVAGLAVLVAPIVLQPGTAQGQGVKGNGFTLSLVGIAVSDREDTTRIASDILASWESGRWRQMAEQASSRVRAHYSSERAEQRLEEIYAGLWSGGA